MITNELIQKFCDKEQHEKAKNKPWLDADGWLHATDTKIAIRLEPGHGLVFDWLKIPIDIKKAYDSYFRGEFVPVDLAALQIPLEDCYECDGHGKRVRSDCDKCRGEGLIHCDECGFDNECKDCNGRGYRWVKGICPDCEGSGQCPGYVEISKRWGIHGGYVKLLRQLPDCRLEQNTNPSFPFRFFFSGGSGLVMPGTCA